MLRVVADTGPLNYLLLIDKIDLLPACFKAVSVPETVQSELLHRSSPAVVRTWAAMPPSWLAIRPNAKISDDGLRSLGVGERAAIQLAVELRARLILMDDRAGVAAAQKQPIAVTGTLGVLDLGARRRSIDLKLGLELLKATNFRHSPGLIDEVLGRYEQERKPSD